MIVDIEWPLTIDKSNTAALKEQADLRKRFGGFEWPEDRSVGSQRDHVARDVEDEPDSEDFAHMGDGITCRDYNTSDTGCRDGKTCRFKHAPASKSIRDQL